MENVEKQIRLSCVDLATRVISQDENTTENVITLAQKIYDFVEGKNPNLTLN